MASAARRRRDYEQKKTRLIESFHRHQGEKIRLGKTTSNLFRERSGSAKRIDVTAFNQVIEVNADAKTADVEGMTTYEDLVDATLPLGMMPAVVPELKTITLGGAATGLGIESSSFKFGLVHETVIELEILLGSGEVIRCCADENPDLYYGFANSYGTLGYALRIKILLNPVLPYVEIRHRRFSDSASYFFALAQACEGQHDFVDGTLFSNREMYVSTGNFSAEGANPSNYRHKNIYYRSIREKSADLLSTADYLWRWDTDWFWCSKNLGAQHPWVRALASERFLNSRTYWKIMAFNRRYKLTDKLDRLFSRAGRESVIQDVEIPIQHCRAFAEFLFNEIGITPIWVCPTRLYDPSKTFVLYEMQDVLYVNFGFWEAIESDRPAGFHNRLIEQKVSELGGKKSLYSDSYYTEEDFWRLYNRPAYEALKRKYDPDGSFDDLYRKCVLKS